MNKISKDLFFSIFFSVLNVLFNMWLIHNAEYYLSAVSLSVFLIMRRVAPSFTNLSQMGASQAIIRFVSLNKFENEKHKIYFLISFLGWFLSLIVLLIVYFLIGGTLAEITYGNIDKSKVFLLYTLWYIAILHLSYLVQPYFLTLRKVLKYNIIASLNASVILIIAFYYFRKNINLELILRSAFIAMSVLEISLLIFISLKLRIYLLSKKTILTSTFKTFYSYGVPRAIITFLDTFLLAIGALLVTNSEKDVSSFLISIVLARMILVVLQPISKLSSVIVGNNNSKYKQKLTINIITGSIIYLSVIFLIIVLNWLELLIGYWLSNNELITKVIYSFKIIVIGLIPYSLFNGLKGIIEINFFKPYNLISLIFALLVHTIMFYVLKQNYSVLTSLSVSLMLGFVILGIFTIYWCKKEFNKLSYFRLDLLFITSIILFAFNYYASNIYNSIIGMLISTTITIGAFIMIMILGKISLINDIFEVLFNKKVSNLKKNQS